MCKKMFIYMIIFLVGFISGIACYDLYIYHANAQNIDERDAFAIAAGSMASDALLYKNYEEALIGINRAIGICPDWYAPYMLWGELYHDRGDNNKACEMLRKSLLLIDKGHYVVFGEKVALGDREIIKKWLDEWESQDVSEGTNTAP